MGARYGRERPRTIRGLAVLLWFVAISAAAPFAGAAEGGLVIGVFPRFNATETTTMYAPLAEHLSERLRVGVTVVTSKDFDSFWKGVEEQRYDVVHYNQYHHIRAANNYRVVA